MTAIEAGRREDAAEGRRSGRAGRHAEALDRRRGEGARSRRSRPCGAIASTHWSFQPVKRPALPATKNPAWARNGIDRFILARLEKEGIAPSPEADRVTLIRRVTLDLLGLPPTPAEVDAFLRDKSAGRLRAARRSAARLAALRRARARHWLDVARYADSNGYTIDAPRSIWKYRDWVIDALNRDLPFDQFTIEQLAGDLLPKPTTEQHVATGFHRNTLINEEGGIDLEQFRVEAVVDRVNTTGTRLARPDGRLLPSATTTSSIRSRSASTTSSSPSSTTATSRSWRS